MILDDIVEKKKKKLMQQKADVSAGEMKQKAMACNRVSVDFYGALAKEGLSIIGEFKKASPSMGNIEDTLDLATRMDEYNQSVDAISCLTEEDFFHGHADDLRKIRKLSSLPIIRKDFIIDSYQIYEAKVIGADAILLIVAILTDEQMREFYDLAESLGLDALVEVHDEEELARALQAGVKIIGVNNRNLKDFTISLETTRRLAGMLPKDRLLIAESGIVEDKDVEFLKESQVDGFLIGRALMESENPRKLACHWKQIFNEN